MDFDAYTAILVVTQIGVLSMIFQPPSTEPTNGTIGTLTSKAARA